MGTVRPFVTSKFTFSVWLLPTGISELCEVTLVHGASSVKDGRFAIEKYFENNLFLYLLLNFWWSVVRHSQKSDLAHEQSRCNLHLCIFKGLPARSLTDWPITWRDPDSNRRPGKLVTSGLITTSASCERNYHGRPRYTYVCANAHYRFAGINGDDGRWHMECRKCHGANRSILIF